jgi:hypothetical protein
LRKKNKAVKGLPKPMQAMMKNTGVENEIKSQKQICFFHV